ncbi:MAG: hypothetical protein ETSY2_48450 [Candidatus Entotheonella gemina]|uniref:Peptidase C13 n=1 Tax=Candidatus Entotheonella gemina TaxID=1429439 RepID=W4LBD2_9BACT|nr:MAG: hypothetical protein ETSY2_48450 [Candidatus Entotheonella gemina]
MARMVMLFFSGGVNEWWNAPRYKNDIFLVAETMLRRQGTSVDDLHILYGAGGETFDLPSGRIIAKSADGHTLKTQLSDIIASLTPEDTFFFLATNHGAPADNSLSTVGLYGWNEEVIEAQEFTEWCEGLAADSQIFIFGQCYSGGFLEPLANHQRVVMAACQWDELSWQSSMDKNYDEFILRFAEAIQSGAETYKDAFNKASEMDKENETPQFSDPGNVSAKTPIPPVAESS